MIAGLVIGFVVGTLVTFFGLIWYINRNSHR